MPSYWAGELENGESVMTKIADEVTITQTAPSCGPFDYMVRSYEFEVLDSRIEDKDLADRGWVRMWAMVQAGSQFVVFRRPKGSEA